MAVPTIPFAEVADLKLRWPTFPVGGEAHAEVLLGDASQFILDTVPAAANASEATRLRIVCAVVRRSMQAGSDDLVGVSQMSEAAGGVSRSWSPSNPNGDFFLTKAEKKALGDGAQRAFGVSIAGASATSPHVPWCNLNFGARYCSCGTDIAGEPIYEVG